MTDTLEKPDKKVLTYAEAANLAGNELGWGDGNRTCAMQGLNATVNILESVPNPDAADNSDVPDMGWTKKSVKEFIKQFKK